MVGEIVAGIIFGGSVLGVIKENEWLEFLSLFGFAYLMFLSGLEINVAMLVRPIGPQWYKPRVALWQPMLAGSIVLALVAVTTGAGVWIVKETFSVDNFWMLSFIFLATAVGVRILLITRNGLPLVPEGDTALDVFDRITLAGDHAAVEEAPSLLLGSRDAGG